MMSDRISKLMNFIQHGTDAVIIYTAANRFYFTGFMSSDGVLVVTKTRAVYFLDGALLRRCRRARVLRN